MDDPFDFEPNTFTGTYLSLEFDEAGRVNRLWARDPAQPPESEEFQFVGYPMHFGEEYTEDYFPGTVMIGARMRPDEPWIASRSTEARPIETEHGVAFEYQFGLLEEIEATGRFYERPGPIAQVVWELEVRNRSKRSIEIGELGFPFCLNNVLEGFPANEQGVNDLLSDRLFVHRTIGGSASSIFAQRMSGRGPGLLIFPGGDTHWEFYTSVPASLNSPWRWDGIPVVYVHSKAVVEREEWTEWFGGHTSTVFEPGESRRYETCFVPADRDGSDIVSTVLAACGRPAIRVMPSAVAPFTEGISVEVSGVTPTQFDTVPPADLETDADEDGGFCFVRPRAPGPHKVVMEDTQGAVAEAHLLFTPPIRDLIVARADWILKHQAVRDKRSSWHGAILPADNRKGEALTQAEVFHTPFGLESGLCDAIYLAEKNAILPDAEQIETVDRYRQFLERRVVNPSNGAAGSLIADAQSAASHSGRARMYALLAGFHHAYARMAAHAKTEVSSTEALVQAAQTFGAMRRHAQPHSYIRTGLPMPDVPYRVLEALRELPSPDTEAIELLEEYLEDRAERFGPENAPFVTSAGWTNESYAEALTHAGQRDDLPTFNRYLRLAMACKSLGPSWWELGSDRAWATGLPDVFVPSDKGEMSLSAGSADNAAAFLWVVKRDYDVLLDLPLRYAFASLMSVWALVREDGAAGMAFCPDSASRDFGMSWTTGDVGLGLATYLRHAAAYVLPMRGPGGMAFACAFETQGDGYRVLPWDGVGRRIIARQFGLEFACEGAHLESVWFQANKRKAKVVLKNHSAMPRTAELSVAGLWGRKAKATPRLGTVEAGHDGNFRLKCPVAAFATAELSLEMVA